MMLRPVNEKCFHVSVNSLSILLAVLVFGCPVLLYSQLNCNVKELKSIKYIPKIYTGH